MNEIEACWIYKYVSLVFIKKYMQVSNFGLIREQHLNNGFLVPKYRIEYENKLYKEYPGYTVSQYV